MPRRHSTNGRFINKKLISKNLNTLHKGISWGMMNRIIDDFIELIIFEVKDGGEVNIGRFGKFYLMDTKPKHARNPKTGQKFILPAGKKIKFVPALQFKKITKK